MRQELAQRVTRVLNSRLEHPQPRAFGAFPCGAAFREDAAQCPFVGSVELIGERWTLLILRAVMKGLRHFEELQACLGIARNILSDRLSHLVASGILARDVDKIDRRKVVYAFSAKGEAMLPVFAALRQWAANRCVPADGGR